MGQPKFVAGDLARLGAVNGRMAKVYPWLRRGRVVRIKAVQPNTNWLGRRHNGYVIAGRRSRPDVILASYELRRVTEREPQGRKRRPLPSGEVQAPEAAS